MENKFASRKFGLTTFVILSAMALLIGKYIDAVSWLQCTYTILGLYFTGNVAEKIFSK